MSLVYFLSKFSREAILIELFLIGCLAMAYFGFLLTKKRKYGIAKNNIPDNVVRAFLIEILSQTEGFKNQLFGENFKMPEGAAPKVNYAAAAPTATASPASDNADLAALKGQLGGALLKQDELGKSITALTAVKADLEAKLNAALAAAAAAPKAAAGGGAPDKALVDKVSKLEAKLAEYEVIEDDLANLKKYQQENKSLRDQIAALNGGAPVAIAPAPVAAVAAVEAAAAEPTSEPPAADEDAAVADPFAQDTGIATPEPEEVAAAPAESPIAAAEESVAAADASKSFEGFVDKVEESLVPEPASGASVQDPFAMPAAAAPPTPAPEAAPAAAAPVEGQKSDADLLNEFERMLNS